MGTSDTGRWIGSRLRDERKRLGWSQQSLADRAGVSQPSIALWERGQRVPGIEELMRLSTALGKDIGELLPSGASTQPIRAVLRAESVALEQGELAGELEGVLDRAEALPPPSVRLHLDAVDPHGAAEQLLSGGGVGRPPVDVRQLAELCGVRVVECPLPDALSGAILELEDGPVIAVNEDQSLGRRRFTIAHELGHHLLRHHDRFHIDLASPSAEGQPPGYNWVHEREANEFAASVLMPAGLVTRLAPQAFDVRDLAADFEVSPLAMSYRLRNLGVSIG